MIWGGNEALIPLRLLLQSPEVGDKVLNIRIFELFGEGGHFAFDASFDDGCNSSIALTEVVEVRSFVPARIVSMAVRAVVVEQVVALLRFFAQGHSSLRRA